MPNSSHQSSSGEEKSTKYVQHGTASQVRVAFPKHDPECDDPSRTTQDNVVKLADFGSLINSLDEDVARRQFALIRRDAKPGNFPSPKRDLLNHLVE